MSKFCELRLIDFIRHSKTTNKRLQGTSEHDLGENKLKRNRKASVLLNTVCSMDKPTLTEMFRNKSKSRASSRTSERTLKSSCQQSNTGLKNTTNSDSLKINSSVETCGPNENIKLSQPKFGCQVIKRLVPDGAEKIMSSQKKVKTKLNIDSKNCINSGEIICNTHEGYKKKNPTKSRNYHTFWNSNLTGARRVSKRLAKLKFKNKNIINPEAVSEKYILKNISQRNSTQEKQSRAQRSVFMSIPQKKLKLNRKAAVNKLLSTRNQPKVSYKYGKLTSHKKQQTPKIELTQQVQTQDIPDFANLHLLKGSNKFCETGNILKSNPTNVSEREGKKLVITFISADSKSGTEDKVSSSIDVEEKINDPVNLDFKIEETVDFYQHLEENRLSENEPQSDIQNNTDTVIQETVSDEMQEDCEENTEIIIVEIETEKGEPSFIPVPENCNNTTLGSYSEEKYQEEGETNESTNILKPSIVILSDGIQSTSLEFNEASISENLVGDEKIECDPKDKMELTPVDSLLVL